VGSNPYAHLCAMKQSPAVELATGGEQPRDAPAHYLCRKFAIVNSRWVSHLITGLGQDRSHPLTTPALSQLNQYPARAATLSKCVPTYSQNVPSMMHTDITCILCHARFPYPSYSALNLEALAKFVTESNAFSKDVPAVLQTTVDFFPFHVIC